MARKGRRHECTEARRHEVRDIAIRVATEGDAEAVTSLLDELEHPAPKRSLAAAIQLMADG